MDGENGQQMPADNQNDGSWQYRTEDAVTQTPTVSDAAPSPMESVSWTASEFVGHAKSASWYGALAGVAVVLLGAVYLFTRDMLSVFFIGIMVVLFGVMAARKPRVLAYSISGNVLSIGERTYSLSNFKSFSIIQEGAFSNITFWPLKRFMPPISIYYDPADEDRIVAVISARLPFENRQHDAIDRFSRKIRF